MQKTFCDRCKKEIKKDEKARTLKLGYGNSSYYGNHYEVDLQICECCQKETGVFDLIEKNDNKWKRDDQPEPTIQDKFFELFNELIAESMQQ